MYTVTQLQQIIHRLYDGSTSYPSSGDEDWTLRLGFMNDAIDAWAFENNNIKWRELYVNLSDASDGDKTTTDGTSQYSCPSDFISISSFLKITDSSGNKVWYPYIDNDEVMNTLRNDTQKKFFYITGNSSSGYKININPTPDETGSTISYSYYKKPTHLSDDSDKPEMSRPYFIVYYTLARLYELDQRENMVIFYETKAKSILDEMIIANEVPPFLNEFSLEDWDYKVNGEAFGL